MRPRITLIESVVVLAVTGVTFLLILPAVQAARSKAREETCRDHLKMIGLALHNYHAANNVYPMSQVLGKGHGTGHSAFALIMPYLEQVAAYNAYNFHLENWHAANATSASAKIAAYLCPENPSTDPVPVAEVKTIDDKPLPGGREFARSHYGVNWGGGHKGFGEDFFKEKGNCRGLIIPVAFMDSKGMPTKNIGITSVIDGTSFTLAIVEKRDSNGWAIGGFGGSEFDVQTSPNYEGDDVKSRRALTGSPHADGLNVGIGDGSVKQISYKINAKVWYSLMTRDGLEIINSGDF
jgi:type II secretory pathway pseudopilin PulG